MEEKVRTFTISDFEYEVARCKQQLLKLGYKGVEKKEYILHINNRFRTTMGLCTYLKGWSKFKIEVNAHFADTADIKELRNVIMHELCHTIRGCNKHTGKWKEVITKVNKAFGYTISRCVGEPDDTYKYEIKCNNCGYSCLYKNKVNVIRVLEQGCTNIYVCGNCESNCLQLYLFEDNKDKVLC